MRIGCITFLKAAEKHLNGLATWTKPTAGMFVWLDLRPSGVLDAQKLISESDLGKGAARAGDELYAAARRGSPPRKCVPPSLRRRRKRWTRRAGGWRGCCVKDENGQEKIGARDCSALNSQAPRITTHSQAS